MLTKAELSGRRAGAVGTKPTVVTKYLMNKDICSQYHGHGLLDFGAGAKHQQLRYLGHGTAAYDTPANMADYAFWLPPADGEVFQTVSMSNVLNVQESITQLHGTIRRALGFLAPGGQIVANYPQSPRYMGLSKSEMINVLSAWVNVRRDGKVLILTRKAR